MTDKSNINNENKYKISVIINVHNGESFIKRAIDSILNQIIKPYEIIVWDNSSTDNTKKIVCSFKNLKYFKSKFKTTLGEARELARNVAKGDWISYLDFDDYWYPFKLKEQINYINAETGIIYGGVDEKDINGNLLRRKLPLYKQGFMLEKQLKRFDIDMVTPLINNNLLKKYNLGFNKDMVASEEQDLFLKICCYAPVITINKPLGVCTIREKSLTNQSKKYWSLERNKTLNEIELIVDLPEYSNSIKEARIQAEYYAACYFASINNFKKVRKIMKSLFFKKNIFKILFFISFSPIVWNFIHKRAVKTVLTNIFKLNRNL